MERKMASYLSERVYEKANTKKNEQLWEQDSLNYYKRLIGADAIDYMLKNNQKFIGYLNKTGYKIKEYENNKLKEWLKSERIQKSVKIRMETKGCFEEFYIGILQYAVEHLKIKISSFQSYYSEKIYEDFMMHLCYQLQAVCTRTLIAEMNSLKRAGDLVGKDSEEEYDFFIRAKIGTWEFAERVFQKYPVLYRCIIEKIEQVTEYYKEIIENFIKDKKKIEVKLCQGRMVNCIERISGNFSDVHNNGRQVVRIRLDNKQEVLYKPRSMENELCYFELLQWIERKTDIRQKYYPILSYKDYSWCGIIKYRMCETEVQLRGYYERLGTQLFLAYFLGTKDLHCENIIASGAYPVLVDLEALVHLGGRKKCMTVNEKIKDKLSDSVLYTGILPIYAWGSSGDCVDASGMNGGAKQKYPFKIPVLIQAGTSDMHIEYQYPEVKEEKNRATLKGKFISPAEFVDELVKGFQSGYRAVMQEKESFEKLIVKLTKTKSRFLIEHTQRYGMALASSYHPSLLCDGAEREIYLNLFRVGRTEQGMKIADIEIQSLLRGDIPCFVYQLDDKNLCGSSHGEIKDYFQKTAMELLYQRLESFCEMELEIQSDYIRCSLMALPCRSEKYTNHVYSVCDADMKRGEVEKKRAYVFDLIDRILYQAIWNVDKTEVSWSVPRMCGVDQHWEMQPMDIYFYDGLSGMLLIFYKIKKYVQRFLAKEETAREYKKKMQEIEEVYKTLQKMLFTYTDSCCKSIEYLYSHMTGAYEGEASIIYAYLKLYEAGREEKYLKHAEKHAVSVYQLLEEDTRYDLLSGNAGAAYVFILLYEVTKNKKYLQWAEDAIEILRKNAIETGNGIGWITECGMPPMAGAAHGNAGILMSIIALWYHTGNVKYAELSERIWRYEDSLYNLYSGNWDDVRMPSKHQKEIGAMAWCHGAAGIMESAMFCYQRVTEEKWKQRLKKDIQQAYSVLKKYWKRDSLSLCHGICGNLWILEHGEKFLTEVLGEKIEKIKYSDLLVQFSGDGLPQENVNPGLMNGYGGVVYRLCTEK